MRFLSMFKTVERNTPPSEAEMAAMGKLIEDAFRAGWLLSTDGCLPSSHGFRVRQDNGKVTVTDGPFTEAKELVGGFAIIQADSKDRALELTKQFLTVAGDGECEVRQLWEAPAS
jgi:hypothetical protein